MDKQILGNDGCSISLFITTLESLPDAPYILENWKKLSRALNTKPAFIHELEKDLLWSRKKGVDLIEAMLIEWSARVGKNAKLEILLSALENDCGWTNYADKIRSKILTTPSILKWTFLDDNSKHILLDSKVKCFGSELSFGTILNFLDITEQNEILNDILCGEVITTFLNGKEIVLAEDTIPQKPAYYVPRTIINQRRIDPNIFWSNTKDVFLVKGIDLAEFSQLVGNASVDRASTQFTRLTSRFLLFEHKNDFKLISRLASKKKGEEEPVHLLLYEEDKFYWLKSHGSLKTLHCYIHPDQCMMSEHEFAKLIDFDNEYMGPVCLADNPGMGKTLLMTNLCKQRQLKHPDRFCIFMTLNKSIKSLICNPKSLTKTHVVNWLCSLHATLDFASEILKRLVFRGKQKIEIFLDGFDEINSSKIELTLSLIRILVTQFESTRVYVSTRLNGRDELEEELGILSYKILPFQEADQVSFLEQYWFSNYNISTNEKLNIFASSLIKLVRKVVPSTDGDIAGIPLQCTMLAEIFQEAAENHATAENGIAEININLHSIADLYQMLMDKRFGKLEVPPISFRFGLFKKPPYISISVLKLQHVAEAVKLLRPEFSTKFKQKFEIGEYTDSTLEQMNALGIVQIRKEFPSGKMTTTFFHRTYAEYLLAEFLVDILDYSTNVSNLTGKLLLSALKLMQIYRDKIISHKIQAPRIHDWEYHWFQEATLPFFLDAILQSKKILCSTPTPILVNIPMKNSVRLLLASAYHDCPGLFLLLARTMKERKFGRKLTPSCFLQHWPDLLVYTVRHSSLNLVQECKELIEFYEAKHFHFWQYSNYPFSMYFGLEGIPFQAIHVTPLHEAIKLGSFSKFEYVWKLYGEQKKKLECLVHKCVNDSVSNTEDVIIQKLSILAVIIKDDKTRVNEEPKSYPIVPILMPGIHFELFKFLIQNGANLFKKDTLNQNVAHLAATTMPYDEFQKFVHLLVEKGYARIFIEYSKPEECPILLALQNKNLSLYYLSLLLKHLDGQKQLKKVLDRALRCAIEGRSENDILELLISHGANPNEALKSGENLLHVAIRHRNISACELLVSHGCDVNAQDNLKRTPLLIAIEYPAFDIPEIVSTLLKLKANPNPFDSNGRLPKWYAEKPMIGTSQFYKQRRTIDFLLCQFELKQVQSSNLWRDPDQTRHSF